MNKAASTLLQSEDVSYWLIDELNELNEAATQFQELTRVQQRSLHNRFRVLNAVAEGALKGLQEVKALNAKGDIIKALLVSTDNAIQEAKIHR